MPDLKSIIDKWAGRIDTPEGPHFVQAAEKPTESRAADLPVHLDGVAVRFDAPEIGGAVWLVGSDRDAELLGVNRGDAFTVGEVSILAKLDRADALEIAWLKRAFSGAIRDCEVKA